MMNHIRASVQWSRFATVVARGMGGPSAAAAAAIPLGNAAAVASARPGTTFLAGHVQKRSIHIAGPAMHYASKGVNRLRVRAERAGEADPFAGPQIVYGMRKDNPTSPWKLNIVAKQIRGMTVDDALTQLQFSQKKAAQFIHKVLSQTKLNAEVQFGIADAGQMHVFESYVGKGNNLRRIRYHAQGRSGQVTKPRTHYFLKIKEGPAYVKPVDPLKKWYMKTKREQRQLYERPKRVIHSLE